MKGVFEMDEYKNNLNSNEKNGEEKSSVNGNSAYNPYTQQNNAYNNFNQKPLHYRETIKKKKSAYKLWQVVLSSVLSAVFAAFIVIGAFSLNTPFLKSTKDKLYDNDINAVNTSVNDTATIKKIEIEGLETPVTAIAEKVIPSIVSIRTTAVVQSWFGTQEGSGEGTGVIIGTDGKIMTNNHVIEGALDGRSNELAKNAKIEVFLQSDPEKAYPAKVIGRDSRTDLAVIKIDAKDLPAAELGDSDELKLGEMAIAIGNPGGKEFMNSVTQGIISGLNRSIGEAEGLIQTDAAINPGNSGGALVNSKGQVIGVNTSKIVAQGYEGLGFAIPINQVKDITESLIEHSYVKGRPYIGIIIEREIGDSDSKRYDVPKGILVAEVQPFTGAQSSGIKPYDIITKFNDVKVETAEELNNEKNKHKPGDIVKIEVYRYEEEKYYTLDLKLSEDKN
jgi:serine protease Do